MTLSRQPQWQTVTVPIEEDGQSAWPDRFPIATIETERAAYASVGKQHKWAQEMMMLAIDRRHLLFLPEHFRYDPLLSPDLSPVYVAIDPARTVKETSSTTGVVAASWIGRRLVIFEATPYRITPSEIVDLAFALEDRYHPVMLGIERDGLEEFLLQPLRHEQLKRAKLLPIKPLKAPRGKDEFIARLQPLFAAGDVVFAGPEETFRAAVDQFLSFPAGFKDVPNALAYLFEMRQGVPVYEDATASNIFDVLNPRPGTLTLAIHAGTYGTAAVICQYAGRVLQIYRDFVREGDPGQAVQGIVEEARLFADRHALEAVIPPEHFERRNAYGLLAACRGLIEVKKGGALMVGRAVIRTLLQQQMQGLPRLAIAREASWITRALLGGYVQEPGLSEPRPSLYATIAQALECALAPLAHETMPRQHIAVTRSGVEYATAEVGRRR